MTTLLDLPTEILLHIAEYAGPIATVNLKLTCKYMNDIFFDKFFWERWAKRNIIGNFPPIYPVLKDWKGSWQTSVCVYENDLKTWSSCEITGVQISDIHYAAIDSIQLTENGQLCLSGARDCTLALWDVKKLIKGDMHTPTCCRINAHKGWIWNMYASNNVAYSASWDKTVKLWDIGAELTCLSSIDCPSTALSVVATNTGLIAVGLYSGDLQLYDEKSGTLVANCSFHKQPVYELVFSDYYIFSASQDKRLGMFDLRRMDSVTFKVTNNSLPLSISACTEFLYVGDSWGSIYLFDLTLFEKKASHQLITQGRQRKISGIKHGQGSILTSSSDGFIRFYTLTDPPKLIKEYDIGNEVISLDFMNNIISVGKVDHTLGVYSHQNHAFFD